jgi:hypothetical protein
MLNEKVIALYGIDQLDEGAQKAAGIAFSEAVENAKHRRYYGKAFCMDDFLRAVGVFDLQDRDAIKDIAEKTNAIIEALAKSQNGIIDKNLYLWGDWDELRESHRRGKIKKSDYKWKDGNEGTAYSHRITDWKGEK